MELLPTNYIPLTQKEKKSMNSLRYYLSIFLLLSMTTTSEAASFQGQYHFLEIEDQLVDLLEDASDFIYLDIVLNSNPNCQETTYQLLLNTKLGDFMAEFFEISFEIDINQLLQYPSEEVRSKTGRWHENLIESLAWRREKRHTTTQDDINDMRQQLEGLQIQLDSCNSCMENNIHW